RDGLADVLTLLANQKVKGDITVIGHSMGAWLTVEALRQLRLTGRDAVLAKLEVVLAAPDIDIDVFRAQTQAIGPLSPPMTVLVSRDDVALSLSGKISGERPRVGTLNVDDPWVREAALRGNFQIIDISTLKGTDGFNHDRYLSLAAYYPKLAASQGGTGGRQMRQAGAFVFNAVGATLAAPFSMAGQAIAGQ
ncbi:MAG TPA: alpha/beta hydrolase, partial [Ancylobacter sp.]